MITFVSSYEDDPVFFFCRDELREFLHNNPTPTAVAAPPPPPPVSIKKEAKDEDEEDYKDSHRIQARLRELQMAQDKSKKGKVDQRKRQKKKSM